MRGTDCSTDHKMVCSKISFTVEKKCLKIGKKQPRKLNTGKLKNKRVCDELKERVNKRVDKEIKGDISQKWKTLKSLMYDSVGKVWARPDRKIKAGLTGS